MRYLSLTDRTPGCLALCMLILQIKKKIPQKKTLRKPPSVSPKMKIKIFLSQFHQPVFQLYRMQLKIHGRSGEELRSFSMVLNMFN